VHSLAILIQKLLENQLQKKPQSAPLTKYGKTKSRDCSAAAEDEEFHSKKNQKNKWHFVRMVCRVV